MQFSIINVMINGKTFDLEIAEETDIKLNTIRKVLYIKWDCYL